MEHFPTRNVLQIVIQKEALGEFAVEGRLGNMIFLSLCCQLHPKSPLEDHMQFDEQNDVTEYNPGSS